MTRTSGALHRLLLAALLSIAGDLSDVSVNAKLHLKAPLKRRTNKKRTGIWAYARCTKQ